MKQQKGITLVALIITIVVMLILVAVTLSIALGDNGIVNKGREAGTDTTNAINKEKDVLNDEDINLKINNLVDDGETFEISTEVEE